METQPNNQSERDQADWYDIDDLARRYKASKRHILRLADSGRMPWGYKLGHLRRWSRRELDAWEAGGCKPMSK